MYILSPKNRKPWMSQLADRIAQNVFEEYKKLVPKGKPSIRSNGVKEWTVLAAVVAIKASNEIQTITLATGVKAQPKEYLDRFQTKGRVLHDSHAEILALRLFNYYLVQEALRKEYLNSIVEPSEKGKLRLKKDVELALYISELPCGDASLSANARDCEEWKFDLTKVEGMVRGKTHFKQKGLLRTKPGRADSPVSLSKSCSDKLCVKQLLGINNCLTTPFTELIYLKWLILPPKASETADDIARCFYERFAVPNAHFFDIQVTSLEFQFAKLDLAQTPSMEAILYLPVYKDLPNTNLKVKNGIKIHEVVNNGVKLGCKPKKNDTVIKPQAVSMCSRWNMFQEAQSLVNCGTYSDLKLEANEREMIKKFARGALGEWGHNTPDDFDL